MKASKTIYSVVLGTVFMLTPFAIDLYLPAFPAMAASFETGIDQIEATVAIFLVGFAFGQLILGPLSDAYGRRRVLIGGMLVFVIASILVGTAQTLPELYAWRFLQALGGAGAVAVFPSVSDRFDDAESTKIISYIMAMVAIAPLVAPIVGGYVLVFAGWRAIFWLIAAIGTISLLATAASVRDVQREPSPLSLTAIAAGYRRALSERRAVLAILAGGLAFAGLFAFVAGSPFVYITHFGVAPEHYGYLVGVNAVAMIGANLVNGRFLAGVDPIVKVFWGAIALVVAGLAILAVVLLDLGLFPLVAVIVPFFAAMGITETNAVIVALSVRPAENGTVAALNGAFQFGVGGVASFLVSVVESTDPMAMAFIMAASGTAVVLCAIFLRRAGRSYEGARGGEPMTPQSLSQREGPCPVELDYESN